MSGTWSAETAGAQVNSPGRGTAPRPGAAGRERVSESKRHGVVSFNPAGLFTWGSRESLSTAIALNSLAETRWLVCCDVSALLCRPLDDTQGALATKVALHHNNIGPLEGQITTTLVVEKQAIAGDYDIGAHAELRGKADETKRAWRGGLTGKQWSELGDLAIFSRKVHESQNR